MAACPAPNRDMLSRFLTVAADQRFHNPASRQEWRQWSAFATSIGQHPYLLKYQGPAHHLERVHVFLAFAAALRAGNFNNKQPASAETITRTLRYCGQVLANRGFEDPRRPIQGQHNLDPAITKYIQTCHDKDPAPVRQQALPASAISALHRAYSTSSDPSQKICSALISTAFFFLLRVGEYTASTTQSQRTVPLRAQDIKRWNGTTRIDISNPHSTLQAATAVTICLENQKNGQKGDTLHHFKAYNTSICPVAAMITLLQPIRFAPPSTPIGTYTNAQGRKTRITANQIRAAVKHAATLSNLEAHGYDLARIGTHSLRAGGAVALKLAGYDEITIRKLGRWSSQTFLIYIRNQIAQLNAGTATAMASQLTYHNVG